MTRGAKTLLATIAVLALLGVLVWRAELFTVQRSGAQPRALEVKPAGSRIEARFDASLPMVPVGVQHMAPNGHVQIVQYWAPWMRHSGPQAVQLDSLRRLMPPGTVQVALVCFDPFPSVSRYVARMRLRLPVLLDLRRELSAGLPCPSIPYTYVIDHAGRVAASQSGEVDWLGPSTRAALDSLEAEREPPAPVEPSPTPATSAL